MRKSKTAVESSPKWVGLRAYLELVETNKETHPGIALDGAKSLLESVAKTILADRGVEYAADDSVGKLVKTAFRSLPSFSILETQDADESRRLISGFESIASSVGALRNRHGTIGHGQDLHDGRRIDARFVHFAIDGVDGVAAFLMEAHLAEPDGIKRLRYEDQPDFNARFDEQEEEIEVAGVNISPSRALFDQDIEAYKDALADFSQKENLIAALEASGTFATTHRIVERLASDTDFSDSQVKRLVEIGCTNTQVAWIMQDDDICAFYSRLLAEHRDVIMAMPEAEDFIALLTPEEEAGAVAIDEPPEREHNEQT